jgi:hypothetical protein
VQDNAQEGIVDVDLAIVLDEAQFPEFVHEKIDASARGANPLCQHLLRHFGKHLPLSNRYNPQNVRQETKQVVRNE